jgi:hypothetical protein
VTIRVEALKMMTLSIQHEAVAAQQQFGQPCACSLKLFSHVTSQWNVIETVETSSPYNNAVPHSYLY